MKFKTERLYIRPVCIEDKEAMFNYRSDSETNKYLSLVPKTVDDVARLIEKSPLEINIPGSWYQLAIIKQSSRVLIGDIGIHFLESDLENKQVEIGYTLDKKYRGKGFATEAVSAVINYLVTSLNKHRIVASIDPLNVDSIKLIERLGFRKEAHFVKSLFFQGKWVDDLVYALLAKEWEQK